MNINSKIHLDEDPAECGRYISYLYRKSGSYFTFQLKKFNLSSVQSIVLVGIYRYEGINQRALAETISMSPGVASRVLRELEDKNYIEKKRDEQNRRNYNLYLTAEGEAAVVESLSVQGDYWNQLIRNFKPEEVTMLNDLLKRMERQASELPIDGEKQ